ncbi:MAG: hypothetical protein ACPGJV_03515 [Bacteriovoracaceae bacterium]
MKSLFFLLLVLSFHFSVSASPLSHAPIGVMGDHVHGQGEFMISLRQMGMMMEEMGTSTNILGDGEYSQRIKPREMDSQMTMLGGMYGITDNLTFMFMGSYVKRSMDLYNAMTDVSFETESKAQGDLKLSTLYDFLSSSSHRLIGRFGMSVPTGSIKENDEIPGMGETRLPYPMQIGSGTWDPSLALTYVYQGSKISTGVQADYLIRTGKNAEEYRLGNEFLFNTWFAVGLAEWVSTSFRLNWKWRDNIEGKDKGLSVMPAMNPTANTENWGGNWLNAFVGFNFSFLGQRLALEYGQVVVQNLHGPQMLQSSQYMLGWQYLF